MYLYDGRNSSASVDERGNATASVLVPGLVLVPRLVSAPDFVPVLNTGIAPC